MRLRIVYVGVVVLSGMAVAQSPTVPDLHLRGGRFEPLTYDRLTPEQKVAVEKALASERPGLNGPFNVTLRSPQVATLLRELGAQLRFHSSLPNRLIELATLMTAGFWNARYEWITHKKSGISAGLEPAVIDAIAAGKRPTAMKADEEIVYNFANELLETKKVSDAAFRSVVDKFGERGAVDLTGVIGYYCAVSTMLNIDNYPAPDDDKAEPEVAP